MDLCRQNVRLYPNLIGPLDSLLPPSCLRKHTLCTPHSIFCRREHVNIVDTPNAGLQLKCVSTLCTCALRNIKVRYVGSGDSKLLNESKPEKWSR